MKIIFLIILFFVLFQLIISEECPDDIKCNNGYCEPYNEDGSIKYICKCNKGYITYPYDNEEKCNYKKKSQLKAFLLELILCYGAGHFYVHNYKRAISKLIVFAFFYCLFIALRIITKAKEENKKANLIICISAGVSLIGMIVWQIIDLVGFGKNQIEVRNNIELNNW